MKKLLKITFTLIFTILLLLGFALPLNPAGNWYQQFMPNLGGRLIQDIEFKDSLTGYSTARQTGDTSYFLRTTNSGDNWQIIYRSFLAMTQIQFINTITGYSVGAYLFKTTNSGINWSQVTAPAISPEELYVLNEDTIWIISSNSLTGGVFRTTNGGASWDQQLNIGSQNPTNIYFYDKDTGFAAENVLYKTTNSGVNWSPVGSEDGFTDMYFVNSLTGWKANGSMKKTTNGGLNWIQQTIPFGGNIVITGISKFACLNKDTLLAVGGSYNTGGLPPTRGIIYRTTNSGDTWLFQVPDTSIQIVRYFYINFINKNNGWCYNINPTGIHTTTGGDPVWLTGITQTSYEIPKDFKLYQNYPNPFNPVTKIKYQILPNVKHGTSNVKLIVFDITGRHIMDLVNTRQSSGTYEVDFSGNNYSSGVYFYRLIVDDYTETKKMLLIK